MVRLIGAPFDLCGRQPGSRLGPIALRMAGLAGALRDRGQEVREETVWQLDARTDVSFEDRLLAGRGASTAVMEAVQRAYAEGDFPMMLGGDHSLSIGSVSGALRALEGDLAVLWVDAHMDLNTPETSPSGNLHGMPLAALCRLGTGGGEEVGPEWGRIMSEVVPEPGLGNAIAWVGLRDVDPGEARNAQQLPGAFVTTMQDIDHRGVVGVMDELDQWLRKSGKRNLWVSFDVDALDPIFAPGTGTAVRGGFTYREGHTLAECLHAMVNEPGSPYRLAGMDVVEVNPLNDTRNETANVAVEWVASLFGRTVMHSYGSKA